MIDDEVEHVQALFGRWMSAGPCGGEGDRDGSGLAFGVGVGDFGGFFGFFNDFVDVFVEVGSEGACSHGRAVAEGAHAGEDGGGEASPIVAALDFGEDASDGAAVAAVGFFAVVLGHALNEGVLLDFTMVEEVGEEGAGHDGVVGEIPGGLGKFSGLDLGEHGLGGAEEAFSEGVADGEAVEGAFGELEGGHDFDFSVLESGRCDWEKGVGCEIFEVYFR